MNPITAAARNAVGNPFMNRMRNIRDTNELKNLTMQQSVVDDEQERLNAMPLMSGQLPRSATPDSRSYTENQQRQSAIANLFGKLTGNPVGVRNGGVIPAGGSYGAGGGGATSALASRAGGGNADDDAYRFKMQQLDIEDRLRARENDTLEGMRRSAADPDHDLFSGKTAARTRAVGDIGRSEQDANADATRARDIEDYWGREGVRNDERYEGVRTAREFLPYNKDVIGAQARLGAADIAAGARLGAAQISGDARVGASAVNTLGRLATADPMATNPDWVESGRDAIGANVPNQGAPATQVFPADRLDQFARDNGFMSAEQAAQFLRLQGWAVQ